MTTVNSEGTPRATEALLAGLILVLATLFVAIERGSGAGTTIAATTVALTANTLAFSRPGIRGLSIGKLTAALALTAFWAKWMLDVRPPRVTSVIPHDNDLAIQVFAVFAFAFTIAWITNTRMRKRNGSAKPPSSSEEVVRGPNAPLILLLGSLTLFIRIWIAEAYSIGVPGRMPTETPFPAETVGILYYLSTYGPVAAGAVLVLDRRNKATVWMGYVLLIAYAIAGANLGSRSYGVIAAVVITYSVVLPDKSKRRADFRLGSRVLRLMGAAAIVLITVKMALQERNTVTSSGSAAEFILRRVGGLEYLSPVVANLSISGSSWSHLSPDRWNQFLRVDVYGYPSDAITGVSGTLPGYLFGVAGMASLFVGGLLVGSAAGLTDRLLARRNSQYYTLMLHLGLAIAWSNLLLEGTIFTSLAIALAFAALSIAAKGIGIRINPREADVQVASSVKLRQQHSSHHSVRKQIGTQGHHRY